MPLKIYVVTVHNTFMDLTTEYRMRFESEDRLLKYLRSMATALIVGYIEVPELGIKLIKDYDQEVKEELL